MLPKIFFWIMVSLDAVALGLVFLLGVGFAGPSQKYLLNVVQFMLLPTGVLVAAVVLFVYSATPVLRGVAFVLAVSPVIIVAITFSNAKNTPSRHTDAGGNFHEFAEGAERALAEAIQSGDFEAVKLALPRAKINAKGFSEMTALTMALDRLRNTRQGIEILRAVLEAGANPNEGGGSSIPPLERAIEMTRTHGTEPMMMLLKAGAKPNQTSVGGEPVFFAAANRGIDLAVMKTLIENRADVKLLNEQGYSAVYKAINRQNWPVALYLLEKGAKIPDVALERLESAQRADGDSDGLAAVLAFVKKANAGRQGQR